MSVLRTYNAWFLAEITWNLGCSKNCVYLLIAVSEAGRHARADSKPLTYSDDVKILHFYLCIPLCKKKGGGE